VGGSNEDRLHNLLPRKLRAHSQMMVSSGEKKLKGRNSSAKRGLDGRLTFSTTVKQPPIKGHKFIPITQETTQLLDIMRNDVKATQKREGKVNLMKSVNFAERTQRETAMS